MSVDGQHKGRTYGRRFLPDSWVFEAWTGGEVLFVFHEPCGNRERVALPASLDTVIQTCRSHGCEPKGD